MQVLRNLFPPLMGPLAGDTRKVTSLLSDPLIPLQSSQNGRLNLYAAAVSKALRSILYHYSWHVKSLPILTS